MKSRIIGVAVETPSVKMTQEESLEHVLKYHPVSEKAQERYRQFFLDPGIQTRHFGFDSVEQVFTEDYDQAVERFERVATEIGAQAVRRCLSETGILKEQIGALIVTTCTGYLCPGLSSSIAGAVGLKSDAAYFDLVGQGCGAALPALRAADHFLKANPDSYALAVNVEVCTAAFSHGEETDLLVSNAIFADGAAASLVARTTDIPGLELHQVESLLWPEYRDELRFLTKDCRLCNVIHRNVPVIAARAVKELFDRFDVEMDQYAFHTGGRVILERVQEALALSDELMMPSREILSEFGNMSSPTVMFVWDRIRKSQCITDEDHILLFAFGAGFSAHALWGIWREAGEK